MKVINDGDTKIPIMSWAEGEDETCIRQAKNAANLPFAFHHLCGMPDFHGGYGVPIGTVLATLHNVVPNAIGVDIGCGMQAVRTNVFVPVLRESHPEHGTITRAILHQIQRDVPIGNGPRGTHEHHKSIPHELEEMFENVTGYGGPDTQTCMRHSAVLGSFSVPLVVETTLSNLIMTRMVGCG